MNAELKKAIRQIQTLHSSGTPPSLQDFQDDPEKELLASIIDRDQRMIMLAMSDSPWKRQITSDQDLAYNASLKATHEEWQIAEISAIRDFYETKYPRLTQAFEVAHSKGRAKYEQTTRQIAQKMPLLNGDTEIINAVHQEIYGTDDHTEIGAQIVEQVYTEYQNLQNG